MRSSTTHLQRFASTLRQRRLLKPKLAASIAILTLCLVPLFVGAFSPAKTQSKQDDDNRPSQLARLSEIVSVRSSDRGSSTINLNDGRGVLPSYVAPEDLRLALDQNRAKPLSLASADFDEDGVPDLVSGYAYDGRGIVTLLRGNEDSIYPNSPEAQQRRANGTFTGDNFLSPGYVFGAPVAPEFSGVGDFDGDSHWDVVVGSRGSTVLYLLSGDGKAGLSLTRELALPGTVTALITGEINRRDGLTDIVVAIDRPDGPMLLAFEGPEGALRAQPETFDVSAPITSLALGQWDDGYEVDLVAASGNELLIVHGRDRKLSCDQFLQAKVHQAKVTRQTISADIKSLTIGDFVGDQQQEIALLSMDGSVRVLRRNPVEVSMRHKGRRAMWRQYDLSPAKWPEATQLVRTKTSSSPKDDLLIVEPNRTQLHILKGSQSQSENNGPGVAYQQESQRDIVSLETESSPVAVLPMRLNTSALSGIVYLANGQSAHSVISSAVAMTFVVNSSADTNDGVCNTVNCTLREAINAANNNPGADAIAFSISRGTQTIRVVSQLPTIIEAVTIDGTTQPGFIGSPLIIVTHDAGGTFFDGLVITSGSSVVRGLSIGGAGSTLFNRGILLSTNGGNIVEGNKFGPVDRSVAIEAPNNRVGGTTAAATNVTANALNVSITITGISATGNLVQGNVITTNNRGLLLTNAPSNLIGGVAAGARNIISGNSRNGITMTGVTGTLIQGNYIGLDSNGNSLKNFETGLALSNSSNNTIGGTTTAARNVVTGNGGDGQPAISINGSGNLVQGNYIGTSISGTNLNGLGNDLDGLDVINGSNNVVGGTVAGARNIISDNGGFGVNIFGGANNHVQGNFIGTDVTGTLALGNGANAVVAGSKGGVRVAQSPGTVIGGATDSARNIISGNLGPGIGLGLRFAGVLGGTGVLIQNNYIGTDVSGTADVGNRLLGIQVAGIYVEVASQSYTIQNNRIAFNGGSGIAIPNTSFDPETQGDPAIRISLDSNLIYRNAALGINLGDDAITPNDLLDTDGGANFQQNFPTLRSASRSLGAAHKRTTAGSERSGDGPISDSSAALTTVSGTLNSTANTTFTVHWYFSADAQCTSNQSNSSPLAFGRVPGVTTNALGNAPFSFPFTFPPGTTVGVINCTATDPNGNTSEFSSCLQVMAPPSRTLTVASVNPSSGVSITMTPNDNDGLGSGTTQFTRTYDENTGVTLTAPSTVSGNTFQKWQRDGVDWATTPVTNVTTDVNHTMTVIYATPNSVQFTSGIANVNETINATVKVDLNVVRSGDTSSPATVKYASSDGTASDRSDYLATIGTLRFAAGETAKSISVFIVDDRFGEGPETFSVTLSNPVGLVLGSPASVTVTINSNETENGVNPVTDPNFSSDFFVRQHYVDFFNREADAPGLAFWKNQIDECTTQPCREIRRINVSAAFFLSGEFQQTGYLVYKAYQAAFNLGEQLSLQSFLPDTQEIGRGVIFGQPGAEQLLETNRQSFFLDFVQRPAFLAPTAYPATLTAAQFVDKLNGNTLDPLNPGAGPALTQSQRDALVAQLANDPTSPTVRAQVVRSVSENGLFTQRQFNKAFVLMQYVGYLRRSPNAAPDTNFDGYNFWLGKLNQFNGNFVNAEMVKAFITSGEYIQRFGP